MNERRGGTRSIRFIGEVLNYPGAFVTAIDAGISIVDPKAMSLPLAANGPLISAIIGFAAAVVGFFAYKAGERVELRFLEP